MTWWKPLTRLVVGWSLMLAGVLIMLEANLAASRPRIKAWPAVQAVAGFAIAVTGWWLRRGALRPPEGPR